MMHTVASVGATFDRSGRTPRSSAASRRPTARSGPACAAPPRSEPISSVSSRVRATLARIALRRADVERLGQIVGGAAAQRLDRGLDAGVAGDQHHRRAARRDLVQQSMPLPSGSIRSQSTSSQDWSPRRSRASATLRALTVVKPSRSTSSTSASSDGTSSSIMRARGTDTQCCNSTPRAQEVSRTMLGWVPGRHACPARGGVGWVG